MQTNKQKEYIEITLAILAIIALLVILILLTLNDKPAITDNKIPSTENSTITVDPGTEIIVKPTVQTPAIEQTIKPKQRTKPANIVGTAITPENILNGINLERYKLGINLVKEQKSLDAIAELKLADMQKYNYWAHDNPITGKKFYQWFADKDGEYPYSYTAEILAVNYKTTQETIIGWMNSPTHYAVITNQNKYYTDVGIAVSGSLVVVEFVVDPKIVSGELKPE